MSSPQTTASCIMEDVAPTKVYLSDAHVRSVTTKVQRTAMDAQFQEDTYYFNYTGSLITITNRMGLPIPLPPKPPTWECSNLVVRKIYNFRDTTMGNVLAGLKAIRDFSSRELELVQQQIEAEVKKVGSNNIGYSYPACVIEYEITSDELRRLGGSIYHHSLDLVISLGDPRQAPTHPHSPRHIRTGGFGRKGHFEEDQSLCIKVRYVDHSDEAANMYLCVLGKVFEVQPEKDQPARQVTDIANGKVTTTVAKDYVEIIYNASRDPDITGGEGVKRMILSLQEAKQLFGLSPSRTASYNFSNTLKERILELEAEIQRLKRDISERHDAAVKENMILKAEIEGEAARTRAQLDEQQAKNRAQLLDLEHRNALLENELRERSMRSKTQYEERSLDRKDQSEMLKHIPTIVLAVVGLYAAWAKLGQMQAQG